MAGPPVVQILDLDGSVTTQSALLRRYAPQIVPVRSWGPAIRLACGWRRFARFIGALQAFRPTRTDTVVIILLGSGDFHHVSLELLQSVRGPLNLLVLDLHPDWMRGVPLLHCGTWLCHAARLPHVGRIFHVGGDVDFDNGYRWLAPWPLLESGKLIVFPALRRFCRGRWRSVPHEPLRAAPDAPVTRERIAALLAPFRDELSRRPLYVSIDKDVLCAAEAAVNWDSGHLTLPEVAAVLEVFLEYAGGRLAGADIGGDWSPVITQGALRALLDRLEHPRLSVDAAAATRRNEHVNLALLECLGAIPAAGRPDTLG